MNKGIAASVLLVTSLNACPTRGIDLDSRIVRPTIDEILAAGGGNISDLSGNLKLKNIANVTGTTVGPSTTSSTYAVIAEMTKTITTKGNNVIIIGTVTLNEQSNTNDAIAQIAIFKDGVQLTQDYSVDGGHTGASTQVAFWEQTVSITFIDNPTAASHTYDMRWRISTGNGGPTGTLLNLGTSRTLQVVELG